MKKIFLTVIIVFLTQAGFAQDTFKADVQKMLELTGSTAQADIAKKQILTMVPDTKKAEFVKEFDALVPAYLVYLEKFYMENFTHEEIKQMIKFYETPVGRKLTEKAGGLAEATTQAAQDWAPKIQGLVMKYMQK